MSVAKYRGWEIINIGYYHAPFHDMVNWQYVGRRNCDRCGQQCDQGMVPPWGEFGFLCRACVPLAGLRFVHSTQAGLVDRDGIFEPNPPEFNRNIPIDSSQALELSHTPEFQTIQGEDWLCHCDDFMDFIGRWHTVDFTQNAADRNGKMLFLEMTDEDGQHLWESLEFADDEEEKSWDEDTWYYAFQCRHCHARRGYWDMS